MKTVIPIKIPPFGESVAFHGSRVAMVDAGGLRNKTVKVWNVETGELLHTLHGHSSYVTSVAMDGGTIVSGSMDATVKVWDMETGNELHTLHGHDHAVRSVAMIAHRGTVISIADDWTVKTWDITSGGASIASMYEGFQISTAESVLNMLR